MAVLASACGTRAGVALWRTPRSTAAAPGICGAADVPEKEGPAVVGGSAVGRVAGARAHSGRRALNVDRAP
jgi:hypothetical protein